MNYDGNRFDGTLTKMKRQAALDRHFSEAAPIGGQKCIVWATSSHENPGTSQYCQGSSTHITSHWPPGIVCLVAISASMIVGYRNLWLNFVRFCTSGAIVEGHKFKISLVGSFVLWPYHTSIRVDRLEFVVVCCLM